MNLNNNNIDNNNNKKQCIGIVCGGGNYPKQVTIACIEKKIDFCLLLLDGFSDNFDIYNEYANCKGIFTAKLGNIASATDFFHSNMVTDIVFAGAIKRPNFNQLALDKKGASWLLKLGKSIFSGDDELLKSIANLLQVEGFNIIAGTEILDDIFVSNDFLTDKKPTEQEKIDIAFGFKTAKTLGALDVGQSVIIHNGLIVGVECVEGTDALIERCAKLRGSEAKGGILVKASKPQQDYRMDLPTVGIKTIEKLKLYNFSGLVVESGKCIVMEKENIIKKSNDYSMFFGGYEFDKLDNK